MTPSTRPTTRMTSAFTRDKGLRQIAITVHGSIIELRCKGLRSREVVDVGSLYERAVRDRVARERFERKAARKARR